MKSNKILFCPAHYVFDDSDRGSEIAWAFNIANYFASKNKGSIVVSGFKNLKKKYEYEIKLLQKYNKNVDLSLFNSLVFNLKYSTFSFYYQKKEDFKIVHHILPFGMNVTYDLFKILFKNNSYKYVIGPIQRDLPYFDDNLSDYNYSKTNLFNKFLMLLLQLFKKIIKYLSIKTLQKADIIIVIDQYVKNKLVSERISSKQIKVIPPGVNTNVFKNVKNKSFFTKKLNLITTSALIKRKRVNLLLEIIESLVEKKIDVHLKILGIGPELEHLKKLVKEKKLSKYISFIGFVKRSEINKYYKNSDLFLTMSEFESWGMMYLEAMSCGLPIISFKNHGATSIIEDSFGFLVNEPNEAVKLIIKLSKNKNLLQRMSKEARNFAEKKYDWKKIIFPQYDDIYKNLKK